MLNRIFQFINRKKFMLKKLKENEVYLIPGEYIFDDCLIYIYRDDERTYRKTYEMFGKSNIKPIYMLFLRLIKILFFNKKIIVKKVSQKRNVLEGSIYFIGIDKNSTCKIFDTTNKKVLTLYFSERDYQLTLQNYQYFKQFLTPPTIHLTDPEKLIIVEELIDFESYRRWSIDEANYVINELFNKYIDYFQKCKEKGRYYFEKPIAKLNRVSKDDVTNFISNHTTTSLLYTQLPLLKLHGDLWAPNILFNSSHKDSLIFIDFEYSDHYYFCYDIFWFIYDQVINSNNYYYLEKYLSGEFDHYFIKMFSIFDLTFETNKRIDYFNVYFLNLIEKRWMNFSKNELKYKLEDYKKMLKKFQRNSEVSKDDLQTKQKMLG